MKTPPFAIAIVALGLLVSGTNSVGAADPNFVQDVDLPPRPDNADYQLHIAAKEYVYFVRVHDLDGELVSENLYESQRAAERSAFDINRREVDRFARAVAVQLPLHWAIWDIYDLRWQAEESADDFHRWGFETDIVEVMQINPRGSTGFTANDDIWLKIHETGIDQASVSKR